MAHAHKGVGRFSFRPSCGGEAPTPHPAGLRPPDPPFWGLRPLAPFCFTEWSVGCGRWGVGCGVRVFGRGVRAGLGVVVCWFGCCCCRISLCSSCGRGGAVPLPSVGTAPRVGLAVGGASPLGLAVSGGGDVSFQGSGRETDDHVYESRVQGSGSVGGYFHRGGHVGQVGDLECQWGRSIRRSRGAGGGSRRWGRGGAEGGSGGGFRGKGAEGDGGRCGSAGARFAPW